MECKNDPDKQFSPKWTYNFINEGEDDGSNFQDAYELLSKQGAVRYSEFTPTGIDTESEYRTWYLNKDNMKKHCNIVLVNIDIKLFHLKRMKLLLLLQILYLCYQ